MNIQVFNLVENAESFHYVELWGGEEGMESGAD